MSFLYVSKRLMISSIFVQVGIVILCERTFQMWSNHKPSEDSEGEKLKQGKRHFSL